MGILSRSNRLGKSDETECEDQEEMDKKLKRRQRNKEAAARCRQRRLDLMGTLQEQVDKFKQDNESKECEIRNMRAQLEKLRTFLRSHDCKMSSEEKEAHINMTTSHMAPQNMAMTIMNGHNSLKRPAPAPITSNWMPDEKKVPRMPQRTDDLELEPDTKVLKIEEGIDKPLSAVNGNMDDLQRPDHLDLGASMRTSMAMTLTTPSNFPPMASFGSFFSSANDGCAPFLGETTGLTPSTQPTYTFVSTATPLQTNESELRNL